MKRILLSPALAAILLVLTFAPCLAGESASPSAALYEHGLDIVSLMVEMAQSDAYISAFSGSGTLHDIVSGICADFVNTDIAAPKAVYALTMDSDPLLEMAGLSDASGLSPALADYLDHRLLAGEAVALHDARNLRFARHAGDPDGVKPIRHTALIEQRHVGEHDGMRRGEVVEVVANLCEDHRVEQAVEPLALGVVGEDDGRERGAVEDAAVKDGVAEGLPKRGQGASSRRCDGAGDGVRIDDGAAELAQHRGDGRFAAGDGAGQSDFHVASNMQSRICAVFRI